jgi:hypothetical protein
MLARLTGKTFLAPILGLLGQAGGEAHDDHEPQRPQRLNNPAQNIQAQAQSLDFDSAVAKYRQQKPPTPPQGTPTYPAQSVPPSGFTAQNVPPPTPLRPPSSFPTGGSSAFDNTPPPSFGSNPPPSLRSNRPPRRGDTDHDVEDEMLG